MLTLRVSPEQTSASAAHALSIWSAAVSRVLPEVSVGRFVKVEDDKVIIGENRKTQYTKPDVYVVSIGKAGYTLAKALLEVLEPAALAVRGRVLVPNGSYDHLNGLEVHGVREPGYNFATPEVVAATAQVIADVTQLKPSDLLICLISGGGSATFEYPVDAVTLEDIVAVSRFLSSKKATIHQMNTVRSCLSRVKCGGLGRMSRANNIETLMISDVPGDQPEIIASGPTMDSIRCSPDAALQMLRGFLEGSADVPTEVRKVVGFLENLREHPPARTPYQPRAKNHVIATNNSAVDAALAHAKSLGYESLAYGRDMQGDAYEFGKKLAEECVKRIRDGEKNTCLVYGGETTVKLASPRDPLAKGGRNQAIVLSAAARLVQEPRNIWEKIVLLAGGTDGEDGPTDAAGAIITPELLAKFDLRRSTIQRCLATNDEYGFFNPNGGLIYTGLTGTNVADVGVALLR